MEVCAVVVTRDRRAQLAECLDAVRAQTRAPDRILVVDNASTDGTAEMLRDRRPDVELLRLTINEGGAGGFHAGLRRAHDAGGDWIWLMDDDTVPTSTCLEALLDAVQRAPGAALLSSKVVWTDGRLHPMNAPQLERERTDEMLRASELGLLPLRAATFVSLLVSQVVIERQGLPLSGYFLWSDDIEYTARILRSEPGYLVPDSVAVHNTAQPYTAVSASGDRFYFHMRNTLYMLRGTAWTAIEKPSLVFGLLVSVVEYLRLNRLAPHAIRVVVRGLRDGLKPGVPTPGGT